MHGGNRLDIYIHTEAGHPTSTSTVERKLDRILSTLAALQAMEVAMSVELDALTAQVKANTDLEASAILLIRGIAAQLLAAKEDPAKIAALSAELNASAAALSQAVTENTTAA